MCEREGPMWLGGPEPPGGGAFYGTVTPPVLPRFSLVDILLTIDILSIIVYDSLVLF